MYKDKHKLDWNLTHEWIFFLLFSLFHCVFVIIFNFFYCCCHLSLSFSPWQKEISSDLETSAVASHPKNVPTLNKSLQLKEEDKNVLVRFAFSVERSKSSYNYPGQANHPLRQKNVRTHFVLANYKISEELPLSALWLVTAKTLWFPPRNTLSNWCHPLCERYVAATQPFFAQFSSSFVDFVGN